VSGWQIPEDGIIDEVAVMVAAAGMRDVRLTRAEQRVAAALIMCWHGKIGLVCARLHVNGRQAAALLRPPACDPAAAEDEAYRSVS
jgi:hypothetical protein